MKAISRLIVFIWLCVSHFSVNSVLASRSRKVGAGTGSKAPDQASLANFDFEVFFSDWRSFDEISVAIDALYVRALKLTSQVSLYHIGNSAEKRPIKVISLGKHSQETSAATKALLKKHSVIPKSPKLPIFNPETAGKLEGKDEILLIGAIHGREWPAVSSVLFSIYDTLIRLESNPSFKEQFLSKTTVHFLPLLNPDGFEYTFNAASKVVEHNNEGEAGEFSSLGARNGKLWRKTRRNLCSRAGRESKTAKCAHGIDLNRNFGIKDVSWGFGSMRPTTEVFQGKKPFSEPESKRIGEWLGIIGPKVVAALDIHCCSSAIMAPFYYRSELQSLLPSAKELCNDLSAAMSEESMLVGKKYQCRDREKAFSESNTGIFADWLANEVGIPNVFIVETRGNRKSRKMEKIFDVKSDEIRPIANEVNSALWKLVDKFIMKQELIVEKNEDSSLQESLERESDIEPVNVEEDKDSMDSGIDLANLDNLLSELKAQPETQLEDVVAVSSYIPDELPKEVISPEDIGDIDFESVPESMDLNEPTVIVLDKEPASEIFETEEPFNLDLLQELSNLGANVDEIEDTDDSQIEEQEDEIILGELQDETVVVTDSYELAEQNDNFIAEPADPIDGLLHSLKDTVQNFGKSDDELVDDLLKDLLFKSKVEISSDEDQSATMSLEDLYSSADALLSEDSPLNANNLRSDKISNERPKLKSSNVLGLLLFVFLLSGVTLQKLKSKRGKNNHYAYRSMKLAEHHD